MSVSCVHDCCSLFTYSEPVWLVTSSKSDQQCCSQAYWWLLLTQSCKAGFIQNKKSLLSSQYSLACFLYNQLIVKSLTWIKSRRAPFPPSIAITGTLGRLRKWHKTFTVTFHCFTTDRFWCLLPPGGQFHTVLNMCHHLSFVMWGVSLVWPSAAKSATEGLQWTPVGLTSENLPYGLRPKVCSDTDLIMWEWPAGNYCI